jgi:hypothetical protein
VSDQRTLIHVKEDLYQFVDTGMAVPYQYPYGHLMAFNKQEPSFKPILDPNWAPTTMDSTPQFSATDYEYLVEKVKLLLSKRYVTSRTHEEAYDFTFKYWGRAEWDALTSLTNWTPEDVPEELKEDDF